MADLNASGAIVSLGGKGGAGGSGGMASVTNSGTITTGYTTGNGGADGIFGRVSAGGGGDGGSSGGLVALGGAGTSGGTGGSVTVTNNGSISTNACASRGVRCAERGWWWRNGWRGRRPCELRWLGQCCQQRWCHHRKEQRHDYDAEQSVECHRSRAAAVAAVTVAYEWRSVLHARRHCGWRR